MTDSLPYSGMTKEQMVIALLDKDRRIEQLERTVSEVSWKLNPDRMGGQFDQYELEHDRLNRWR